MDFGIPKIEELYARENNPDPEVMKRMEEFAEKGNTAGGMLVALNVENIPEAAKEKLRAKAAMIGGLMAIAAGALAAYQLGEFASSFAMDPQSSYVAGIMQRTMEVLGGAVAVGGIKAFFEGYTHLETGLKKQS